MSTQENVTAPSSGLYTCLACQVAFKSAEGQRNHYRSDWHRYNLKRKVVSLPPVTLEQFSAKSDAREAQEVQVQKEEEANKNNTYCATCRKSFGSTNQYDNHIQSKKHKETLAKQASKQEATPNENTGPKETQMDLRITEETTEEEMLAMIDEKIKTAPRLEETDCLFCTHKSETFEDNMTHMTNVHSLFIPDIEFLVDLRGLIRYLGEKITVGNVCIFCNGKGKSMRSVDAVRKHMNDKGHCKIAYDEDDDAAELVDFYDFSSSYPQAEDGEEVDIDAELEGMTAQLSLADDEMSLVLPNGNVVGHRHMKRYYDQKLKPEETRDSILINKLIGQYSESPAFESMRNNSNNKQRLLITDGGRKNMRATEAYKDLRNQHEYTTRVGINQNRLQKHFRIQII
ncbi:C2H2 type zinc-finger-domain-containing protein [Choanephora cucurbitarum]|nr:C2H2 type zinc-finger-domain-containing protein [Choanephora cucurbitarum]